MRDGWVEKKLVEICDIYQPETIPKSKMRDDAEFTVYGANGPIGRYDRFNHDSPEVVVTCRGATCGTVNMTPPRTWITGNAMVFSPKNESISKSFLFYSLDGFAKIDTVISGSAQPQITREGISPLKILLPPHHEQKRIVDLISSVDSYINALQQHAENARKSRSAVLHEMLSAGGDGWVETTLGEVADWGSGGTPKADIPSYYGGEIPWCVIGDLTESEVRSTAKTITEDGLKKSSAKMIPSESVMLAMYGASIGRTGISAISMATNQAIAFATTRKEVMLSRFLLIYLQTQKSRFIESGQGAAQPNISQTIIKSWPIPLPPIEVQTGIISMISTWDDMTSSIMDLLFRLRKLRSALLSDLLSGEHEIPESYDNVMGAA